MKHLMKPLLTGLTSVSSGRGVGGVVLVKPIHAAADTQGCIRVCLSPTAAVTAIPLPLDGKMGACSTPLDGGMERARESGRQWRERT
jgi:hypothetical protein